ncbi:hypothetical protein YASMINEVIRUS_98 [Yasminevirus sp. GU-2018]|uniref:Protein kinase domain-containing protein n=1 Tax=Yasminevirus sp. GU-2018 TaxID=2420051 RepID=A0A5K0U760_9VIRU|nr:hypothetical protein YASMINEVIRUS_98 [Yasminevirus sp. GU-2018]
MSKVTEHYKYGMNRPIYDKSNNTVKSDQDKDFTEHGDEKQVKLPAKFQKILDRNTQKNTSNNKKKRAMSREVSNQTDSLEVIDRSYSNAIIEFFEDSSIQDIATYLHNFLFKRDACDQRLGEGAIGYVVQRSVGDTYKLSYPNGVTVDLPVVVKEVHVENQMYIDIFDGELFVSNSRGISVEALLLYFIKPLIQLKLSPHLPLILDHGKCILREVQPVDKIVLERHGLPDEVSIKIPGLYESPMWRALDGFNPDNPTFNSRLTTFDDLTVFMHLTKDSNNNVTLPNNEVCNIVELIDYLSISYLVTYDLLYRHNIHLLDMHPQNILIHWLNKQSYLHDQYVGDTKYIFYKVGDKIYKIKTFGIMLKIGDVGASIARPRRDVYLVGQAYDIQLTQNIVREITQTNKCHDFLNFLGGCVPLDVLRQTVAYKILNSDPYDKILWISQGRELLKRMLSVPDLLKMFDKYSVKEIDEISNYLVF